MPTFAIADPNVSSASHAHFPLVRQHPFLLALKQTRFGTLSLLTPEGARLNFSGDAPGPSAIMTVRDWSALDDGLTRGEIGFAEGYIHRTWDSPDLAALLTFALLNAEALERFFVGRPWYGLWLRVRQWRQKNSLKGSRNNILAHYDLGNDFYRLWLDDGMTYSSALFEEDVSRSLEAAQEAKYRRILRTIGAQVGDHLLDIGCGWGGFAELAAYEGMRVTAITLSEAQADYARARMRRAGVANLVHIELMDYRELSGTFDHIVSIGMFEHVGKEYWPAFFSKVQQCLKPGASALIQTITLDDALYEKLHHYGGFISHYIFPGGWVPSKTRFSLAVEQEGLRCRELFSFGQDYARTLTCWLARFEWKKEEIEAMGYEKDFIRLWRFYLASCMASFLSRRTDVMQALLTHA